MLLLRPAGVVPAGGGTRADACSAGAQGCPAPAHAPAHDWEVKFLRQGGRAPGGLFKGAWRRAFCRAPGWTWVCSAVDPEGWALGVWERGPALSTCRQPDRQEEEALAPGHRVPVHVASMSRDPAWPAHRRGSTWQHLPPGPALILPPPSTAQGEAGLVPGWGTPSAGDTAESRATCLQRMKGFKTLTLEP